jgi:hypothetical protein
MEQAQREIHRERPDGMKGTFQLREESEEAAIVGCKSHVLHFFAFT